MRYGLSLASGALLGWLPLAAGASGSATPLWRGEAGSPCDLRLTVGGGGLEVIPSTTAPRLLGAPELWRVETAPVEGRMELTATLVAGTPAEGSSLMLEAPASCRLRLSSPDGRLEARGAWRAPLELESETGEITLLVDRAADLSVELATSGEITVDFSVTIDYVPHREPSKLGRIRVGQGTYPIRLTSRIGGIRVLRSRD